MSDFKNLTINRWICGVLVLLLALPAGMLQAAQPDPLEQRLATAREAWKQGDLPAARTELLEIMAAWQPDRTPDAFRGKVHLLMGAVAEKMGMDEESVQHFCLARTFLGDAIPLEELQGETFSNYSAACGAAQMVAIAFQRSLVLFLAEDYEGARLALEPQAIKMQQAGADTRLQGKVSLLMGAVQEKLKNQQSSTDWFCRAKELLGRGHTFSWLDLADYRNYQKSCNGVVAVQGKKKRGFGKFLGFLLGAAILGGLVWYLFINKNSPIKKGDEEEEEPGNYTSITFRLQVTYKGLNSKGQRRLSLDNVVKHNALFNYTANADANSTCEDAVTDKTITITQTITGNSVVVRQEFINWNYVHFVSPGTNYKLLCTDWNMSIQSYTWETGKADPGSPQVSGLDGLSLDTQNDCTQVTTRVHNCTTEATLTFSRHGSTSGSDTWSASQAKIRGGDTE